LTRGGFKQEQDDDPERKCIVSGEVQPKAGLIRFCLDPEGQVVPDVNGKLPGRGFYVTADRAKIEKAAAKGLFSRAAKGPAKVPEGLADLVEHLIARRLVDSISLARKANEAVTGYEKVKEWLMSGRAVLLVQASDGSERGKAKFRPPAGGFIGLLTAAELGLAFGRERAIHAALATGTLARRVVDEAARLEGLRVQSPEQEDGEDSVVKDM